VSLYRLRTPTLLPVLLAAAALACAGADPPAPAAVVKAPAEAIRDLDRFTDRLGAGAAVTDPEFQATMEPFAGSVLASWSEDQVASASSSLNRLRTALLARYRVSGPQCAEDGLIRYSICGDGYLCVASAQVTEVRCLWFLSTGS
jgi:hypothetical protein